MVADYSISSMIIIGIIGGLLAWLLIDYILADCGLAGVILDISICTYYLYYMLQRYGKVTIIKSDN